jgi:23S rRNA (guanine745-N1)-methyltransferase
VSPAAQLCCPICAGALVDVDRSARCADGHNFDYARSGYLNLTVATGPTRIGDTAAMVTARDEFLAAGHYGAIADAVAAAVASAGGGPLIELGSGTGYYLAAALSDGDGAPSAFGFDLSKPAAGHAARRHPGIQFVVADVEAGVPLAAASVNTAISVFSPRPAAELGRVVRPGGELVVALAGPRHLERLRERLTLMRVHDDKLARLGERLAPWFSLVGAETVEYEIELGPEDARRLVLMGPNAWHKVELGALEEGHADLVSVIVARYRRDDAAANSGLATRRRRGRGGRAGRRRTGRGRRSRARGRVRGRCWRRRPRPGRPAARGRR